MNDILGRIAATLYLIGIFLYLLLALLASLAPRRRREDPP